MPISEPATVPEEFTPARVDVIRDHLRGVLCSQAFDGSKRAQSFLKLVVERAIAGRHEELRERVIGAEMFGRPIDYDTANDAVVRVKASEVRKKLAQYYRELHEEPPVRIELPSGSYVPKFHWPTSVTASMALREQQVDTLAEAAPAPGSAAQQFVTIAQELPDAFTVVLEALQELSHSVLPVEAPSLSPQRRVSWKPIYIAGLLLAIILSILSIVLVFGRR
jgi:hypothetical protein